MDFEKIEKSEFKIGDIVKARRFPGDDLEDGWKVRDDNYYYNGERMIMLEKEVSDDETKVINLADLE